MRNDNIRGIAMMIASMAFFAIEDLFLKFLGPVMPPHQILFLVGYGGAIAFALWAMAIRTPLFTAQTWDRLVLIRIVCDFFGAAFFILAIVSIPLSSLAAIIQAIPLFVTLGAVLFLNERVGIRRWAAILIGFGGVLLIVRPGAADFQIGMVYAVISVAMLALRDMLMRVIKTTLHSSSFGFYGFFAMGTAGVLIWPFSDHMIQPNAVEWVYIFVAIITAVLGYFAIIISTRIAEASTVAPYRYTRLIFSTLLAMAFLGERPDLLTWVGSAIVIASGLYTFWRERVRATGEIS
ncbi:MAG: DMT family transporter [Paracoccaceae bacterium]